MDDHDGLCPECNGDGLDLAVDIPEGWYFDQSFAEVIDCIACAGTGTLTAIPTEEEAEGYDPWEADEYERWLDGL